MEKERRNFATQFLNQQMTTSFCINMISMHVLFGAEIQLDSFCHMNGISGESVDCVWIWAQIRSKILSGLPILFSAYDNNWYIVNAPAKIRIEQIKAIVLAVSGYIELGEASFLGSWTVNNLTICPIIFDYFWSQLSAWIFFHLVFTVLETNPMQRFPPLKLSDCFFLPMLNHSLTISLPRNLTFCEFCRLKKSMARIDKCRLYSRFYRFDPIEVDIMVVRYYYQWWFITNVLILNSAQWTRLNDLKTIAFNKGKTTFLKSHYFLF